MHLRFEILGVLFCATSVMFTACETENPATAVESSCSFELSSSAIAESSSASIECSSASNSGPENVQTQRCTYSMKDGNGYVTLLDVWNGVDVYLTTRINYTGTLVNMTYEMELVTQSQSLKKVFCQQMLEDFASNNSDVYCVEGRLFVFLAETSCDPSVSVAESQIQIEELFKAQCDSVNSLPEIKPQSAYKVTNCEVENVNDSMNLITISGDGWSIVGSETYADANRDYVTGVTVYDGFDRVTLNRICANEKMEDDATVTCFDNQIKTTTSADNISFADLQDIYNNAVCPALLSGKQTLESILFDNEEN